jgi:hypothetical protein
VSLFIELIFVVIVVALTVGASEAFDLAVIVTDAKVAAAEAVVVAMPIAPGRHRRVVGMRLATPAGSVRCDFASH